MAPASFAPATENNSMKYVNEFRPTTTTTPSSYNFMTDLSLAPAFKPSGYIFMPTQVAAPTPVQFNTPNNNCGFNMSDQHAGTFVASSCQNIRSDSSATAEFIT